MRVYVSSLGELASALGPKENHLGVSHLFFEGPTACSVGQITHCSPG
jgi:hypothetical protein